MLTYYISIFIDGTSPNIVYRRKEVKIEEPSPLQLTILHDYHGAMPQPPLYKHCGGQLLDRGAVVKLVY